MQWSSSRYDRQAWDDLNQIAQRMGSGNIIDLCHNLWGSVDALLNGAPLPWRLTDLEDFLSRATRLIKENRASQLYKTFILVLSVKALILDERAPLNLLEEIEEELEAGREVLSKRVYTENRMILMVARCRLAIHLRGLEQGLSLARAYRVNDMAGLAPTFKALFLTFYSRWLNQALVGKEDTADYFEHPYLVEEEEVLTEMLALAENHSSLNDMVVSILLHLVESQEQRYHLHECLANASKAMRLMEAEGFPPHYFQAEPSPSYMKVANSAGWCLLYMKRYDDAVDLLRRAIEVSKQHVPDSSKALVGPLHRRLGIVCYDQGRYDEAVKAFLRSFELEGMTDNIWRLGDSYEGMGNMDMALEFDHLVAEMYGGVHNCPASTVCRMAREMVSKGNRQGAIEALRAHLRVQQGKGILGRGFARSREVTKKNYAPFSLLASLLEEDGRSGNLEEVGRVRAMVQEALDREDTRRREVLEEIRPAARAEVMARRASRGASIMDDPDWDIALARPSGGGSGRRGAGRKAGKKKKKGGSKGGGGRKGKRVDRSSGGGAAAGGGGGGGGPVQQQEIDEVAQAISRSSMEEQEEGAGSGDEEEVEESEECAVCLLEMEEDDEVDTLPCHHRFHRSCIDKWQMICLRRGNSPSCPYCRGDL